MNACDKGPCPGPLNCYAAGKCVFQGEWRICQYCGCRTNARIRRCCDKATDEGLHNAAVEREQ